jgi:peptide/nickel transport system ATP-binding protein
MISHNLAVIEHMATRVAVMYLGRLIEESEAAALFSAPRHPYTKVLLESVLTPDPAKGVPEPALGVSFPNPAAPPPGCRFHPRCPEAVPICSRLMPPVVRCGRGLVECHLHAQVSAPDPGAEAQPKVADHAR